MNFNTNSGKEVQTVIDISQNLEYERQQQHSERKYMSKNNSYK